MKKKFWWEKLEDRLDEAIGRGNQDSAVNVLIDAFRAYEQKRITLNKLSKLQNRYDAWERSWAK